MPQIFSDYIPLRQKVQRHQASGQRIGFVPTMGALHEGHLSLVKAAQQTCPVVVVSIFVNPLQFGPSEDFSRYPRTLEADIALLKTVGVDYIYTPTPDSMYPAGFSTNVQVHGVSDGLCGAARPGHFDGVATVVAKLLSQVGATDAYFGEKDYQQLCIIRRMVTDLCLSVFIHPVPTHREADGLAMSSRNRYLSEAERAQAAQLFATLSWAAAEIKQGASVPAILDISMQRLKEAGFSAIDYFELRQEETLTPLAVYASPARLLAAARLGQTRLIDNLKL